MINWPEFNNIINQIETLYVSNKRLLSNDDKKYLQSCKCWLDNLPYCSWDNFNYNLSIANMIRVSNMVEDMPRHKSMYHSKSFY